MLQFGPGVLEDTIAPQYESKPYGVNDVCIYNGKIYRCIVQIPYPESWTPSHWVETTVIENAKQVFITENAIPIPAENTTVTYDMSGITDMHQLVRWNFSDSPENVPPVSLTWSTANGQFTITNLDGSTEETIRPVFICATSVTATAHVEPEGDE